MLGLSENKVLYYNPIFLFTADQNLLPNPKTSSVQAYLRWGVTLSPSHPQLAHLPLCISAWSPDDDM